MRRGIPWIPIVLFVLGGEPLAGAEAGGDLDLRALFREGIPASPFVDPVYLFADGLAPAEAARDPDLLRILFFFRDLSGDARYTRIAEEAIRRLLEDAPPPEGGAGRSGGIDRPWLLWEASFAISPEAARRRALEGWPAPAGGEESLRRIGFRIRTWAEGSARTGDPAFPAAIAAALGKLEEARGDGPAGAPAERLSLAIDCAGAARKVPEPLRGRLVRLALREDEAFLESCRGAPALPAKVAMMCVARYENGGGHRFREPITAAADGLLGAIPAGGPDPTALGHAISLELAAFRATAREAYFRRASDLGLLALERHFGKERKVTGVLALALADLHLVTRGISAARAPANTGDR